jgi:hypothetical protein
MEFSFVSFSGAQLRGTVPLLRALIITGFPTRLAGFDLSSGHVRFVVNKVAHRFSPRASV